MVQDYQHITYQCWKLTRIVWYHLYHPILSIFETLVVLEAIFVNSFLLLVYWCSNFNVHDYKIMDPFCNDNMLFQGSSIVCMFFLPWGRGGLIPLASKREERKKKNERREGIEIRCGI